MPHLRQRSAGRERIPTPRSPLILLLALALGSSFSARPLRAQIRNTLLLDARTAAPTSLPIEGGLYCSCPDGSGGMFVGGTFESIGGLVRSNAAHIRADGTIDPWNPSPNQAVTAIALSGSTVYLGGTFSAVGGVARGRLAAVDASTGALASWAPTADAQTAAIVRIGDRVFAGGAFSRINGTTRVGLAAIDAVTGALLPYSAPLNSQVYALAVRDTELFVGGEMGLLALSPTTARVTRTLPSPNAWIGALAISGDDLYLGGGLTRIGGQDRVGLAAIDLRTNSLSAWDPRAGGSVRGVVVSGDAVFVCGSLNFPGGGNHFGVAKLSRLTARSAGWATPYTRNEPLTVQVSDAGVLVGAAFEYPAFGPAPLPRPDPRYPEISGAVFASAVVGDTLFVGGNFQWVAAPVGSPVPYVQRSNLAAIRISTGELLDWKPFTNGTVKVLRPYRGSLIAGGAFSIAGPDPVNSLPAHGGLAMIDRATGVVAPWNSAIPMRDLFDEVKSVDVVNDTLYAVGRFAQAAGLVRNNACAFDLRTGALTGWDPNLTFGGPATSVLRLENRVLIAGGMLFVGGVRQERLAEVDPVTGTLGAWRPAVGNDIYAMLRVGNTLYIGGAFATVNGQSRPYAAAFSLADGSLLPWRPNASFEVQALSPLASGILLAWNTNYQGSSPQPSLLWADATSGAELQPLSIFTSDRIWTMQSAGGTLFLGGAFPAISGTTDHAWFAGVPTASLPTPVLASIVRVDVGDGRVSLRVFSPDASAPRLERREGTDAGWAAMEIEPARVGTLWVYEDRAVDPGHHYRYRLRMSSRTGPVFSSEIEVHVPDGAQLSIAPVRPSPNAGEFELRWSMPRADAALLEVLDLSGRRVYEHRGTFDAGAQSMLLRLPRALPPGLYLVRVRTAGSSRTSRFYLMR